MNLLSEILNQLDENLLEGVEIQAKIVRECLCDLTQQVATIVTTGDIALNDLATHQSKSSKFRNIA